MLEIRNLCMAYGKREVLHDICLDVHKNEVLGIVGESGSGKSTLLHTIVGIAGNDARVLKGSIRYEGNDFLNLSEKEKRRILGKDISFVFQHPSLTFDPITKVEKQVYESAVAHQKRSRKEVYEEIEGILRDMKLENPKRVLNSYPFELSGGMCQRVALAIAMLNKPKLWLADEPTSALDVTVQAQVIEIMQELKEKFQMSILIVTHNMGIVAQMADRMAVMYQGNLVELGDTCEVLENPQHAYTKRLIQAVPKLPKMNVGDTIWRTY